MTIIKLQGGLGNQMFQYAYGRKLEFFDKKIAFDTSFFNKNTRSTDTAREFKLNNFNIETKARFLTRNRYLKNILNKIKSRIGFKQEMFFANENYFKEIRDIIRDEFTLKNKLGDAAQKIQDKILSCENSISLHIRRGDYVNNRETNNYHGTCSLEYYQKAIEIIKDKVGDDICIFVFSDDIEWAKNNLKTDFPTEYVSNPNIQDYEEMILMSKCSHNIIGNSTFSWWGAWLNQNSNKIVIAPQKWFNNQRENSNNKIVPDSWIKI